MAELEHKTGMRKRAKKNENECQRFIALLKVSCFIYNKTIYIFRKYMKQAFISYIDNADYQNEKNTIALVEDGVIA